MQSHAWSFNPIYDPLCREHILREHGARWMQLDASSGHSVIYTTSWHLKLDAASRWNECVGWKLCQRERRQDCHKQHTSKKKKMNVINVNLRRNFKSDSEVLTPLSCPTFESQLCIFLNSNGLTLGLKISDTCRDKSDSEMGLISELVFDAMVQCGNYISCL